MKAYNYFCADKNLLLAARQYSRQTSFPMLFGRMVTGEQFIEDDKGAGNFEKNCEAASRQCAKIVTGILGQLPS